MSNIRYVCLSDMHLGEEDSLLTNITGHGTADPKTASPVMVRLVECMKHLISQTNRNAKKPTLVLNGDILELALTTTEKAAMVFERFIELTMPAGGELFGKIIYIPGNHDHHFWEVAREVQYGNYIALSSPGDDLDTPWHTTSMFVEGSPEPVNAYLLTKLVQRFPNLRSEETDDQGFDTAAPTQIPAYAGTGDAQGFTVPIAYPNLGILSSRVAECEEKEGKYRGEGLEKCVVFHHGHFIESMYQLVSTLRTMIFPESEMPEVTWDIEAENFAWIDFFWSTFGRSGKAGEKVELVFEKLQEPKQLDRLISNLAESLADRYDIPKVPAWLEDDVFRFIIGKAVSGTSGERGVASEILTPGSEKGLWAYMEGPLRKQILTELEDSMPADFTFVFGHTHKPFQEDMVFGGYQQEMNVYNTGGWIVESVEPEPLRGGAVVLVDEELNATSLRMYNEAKDRREYRVKVEEAGYADGGNSFHQRISDLVDPEAEPWKSFSETTADEVHTRARNLRSRMNSSNG